MSTELPFADRLRRAYDRGAQDVAGLPWKDALRHHEQRLQSWQDPDLRYAYHAGFVEDQAIKARERADQEGERTPRH
jgi:hypothetical protein